jgi:hypothetical protein
MLLLALRQPKLALWTRVWSNRVGTPTVEVIAASTSSTTIVCRASTLPPGLHHLTCLGALTPAPTLVSARHWQSLPATCQQSDCF